MRNVTGDEWKWSHKGTIITNTNVSTEGVVSCDDGSHWHNTKSYLDSIKRGGIILVKKANTNPMLDSLLAVIRQ